MPTKIYIDRKYQQYAKNPKKRIGLLTIVGWPELDNVAEH